MIRLLRIFLLVALLAALAAWLADNPGSLVLDWQGYRIETSFVVALGAAGLLFAALHGVLRAWGWLRGPQTLRYQRGLQSLTQGMAAIAAGNADTARRHAARAGRLLGAGPLSLLLRAQAAQLAGDEPGASADFAAMAAVPDGELLGLRGLVGLAQRRGEISEARRLLERAAQLSPKSAWVNRTRFEVECAAGEWPTARQILDDASKAKLIGKPDYDRRRAVLALLMAQANDAAGASQIALEHALEAVKYAPSLAPAAVLAARLLTAAGKSRQAAKLATGQRVPARQGEWICAACNRRGPEWRPLCPHCGGFDTQQWRDFDDRRAAPERQPTLEAVDAGRIVIFEPPARPDDPGPS